MFKKVFQSAAFCASAACSVVASAADFNVGLRNLNVPYHGSSIETSVWYPTAASESVQNFGPYAPKVAVDAPVAEAKGGASAQGKFPIVLVSHGTGGSAMGHYLQAEALARAGFVVVSLTHPGDNFQDRSLVPDKRYLFERPRQVSAVLDALLASTDWKDRVDAGRVGAYGHSAGGYAVAALIGGIPDLTRLAVHCQSVKDDPSCDLRDPSQFVVPSNKVPLTLPDSVLAAGDVSDKRVRAAVMVAPWGAPVQSGSLKNTMASVKLIGAEFDQILPAKYHFEYLRSELPQGSDKVTSRIAAGAGHLSFVAPVPPEWKARMGVVAVDPPGFDRAALHQTLSPEVVAFFEKALKP